MLQACRRADLGQEPVAPERRTQVRVQDLDGDVAVVLEIVREIHRRHSTGTELPLDAIAVGERVRQPRAAIAHGAARWPARRFATIAGRFWITITRDDGFDRMYTNVRPSGETSKLPCGFAVTMPVAGKSAFREVTASVGCVATAAATIIGSRRVSSPTPPR
jgi:hypothetical protein